ncbi:IL15 protein, partial [Cinclus mexicanus]|nr:IL15 protein [Cinclus mexicanus]
TMCKVLIFGCIAAVILMTAAYGAPLQKTELSPAQKQKRLEASIIDLAFLKHIDNNFLDFYTPNDKRECNHTTLACFLKELNVLKQDVEEKDMEHVINIEKNLEDLKDPDFSNPTCKKCESNEKKKFAEFHQEMTSFLQSMQK